MLPRTLQLVLELVLVGFVVPIVIFLFKRAWVDELHKTHLKDRYPRRRKLWTDRMRDHVWGNELAVIATGVVGSMALASPRSLINAYGLLTQQAQVCAASAILILCVVAWSVLERVLCKLPHGGQADTRIMIKRLGVTISPRTRHVVTALNALGLLMYVAVCYFVIGGEQ
jgi:hypothetical protein